MNKEKEIHLLNYNDYSKFMCEQLHYLLEMGLDYNYKFVKVEDVIISLNLLINDLYAMSENGVEKELEYPDEYIQMYEKELEEKKVEIEELENEIKKKKKYYN